MSTRVLLVDDHPLFREGLATLLRTKGGFEVVGEAADGQEAVAIAENCQPELVVMDIRMPGTGGLEATRQMKSFLPEARIVMLSVSDDEHDLFEAVQAGAQGYIVKNMASQDVADLLARAARGEAAFTPRLASNTLIALGKGGPSNGNDALSTRERQVLERLVEGRSNAQIATDLGVRETTVRFHLRNILSKLHAHSRTEAAVHALRQNIVRRHHSEST